MHIGYIINLSLGLTEESPVGWIDLVLVKLQDPLVVRVIPQELRTILVMCKKQPRNLLGWGVWIWWHNLPVLTLAFTMTLCVPMHSIFWSFFAFGPSVAPVAGHESSIAQRCQGKCPDPSDNPRVCAPVPHYALGYKTKH